MPISAGPQDALADIWNPEQPLSPEYDALADLFLPGDGPSPGRKTDGAPAQVPLDPAPSHHRSVLSAHAPSLGPARPPASVPESVQAPTAAPVAPRTELIVLGHLPTYAPAWAGQYARSIATELGGQVAMIRCSAGEISIDLIGGIGAPLPTDSAAGRSLSEALAFVRRHASRVLLRVDEIDEPLFARAPGVFAVTLLCGGDEASIVAAYRAIKPLLSGAERETAVPEVRIAFMGTDPPAATAAFTRLERAASAFTGRSPVFAGVVNRIEPARAITLHRGDAPMPAALLESLRSDEPTLPEAVSPAPAAPTAPDEVKPRQAHASRSIGLASWLEGVTPTGFACPDAPDVEISADAAGRLRLLANAGPGASQSLLAAREWAEANAAMLAVAASARLGRTVLPDAPVLHCFGRSPADLRGLGRAGVTLHLLTAARRNADDPSRVCIDLG